MDKLDILEAQMDIISEQVIALTQTVWELAEVVRQGKMVETIPLSSRRHKKGGPITDITYISYCSRLRKYREEFKQTGHYHWKREVEALEDRIIAAGRELPADVSQVQEPIPTKAAELAKPSETALGVVIRAMSVEEIKEKLAQTKKEKLPTGE